MLLRGRDAPQMRHRGLNRLNQPVDFSLVFFGPSENRTLDRASSAVSPIASSTCDGSTAPLEQAEPLDTA